MIMRIHTYVGCVVLAAVAAVFAVAAGEVVPRSAALQAALSFVVLGLLFHSLSYSLNRNAAGSISFIPFLTAIVLAPNWTTPPLIGCAILAGELFRRAQPIKTAFNVAQQVVAACASVWVYNLLGGVPLLDDERFLLLPYSAAVIAFLVCNTAAVSGAVASSSGRKWLRVWRDQTLGTVRYDLVSFPTAYLFALVYNRFALAGIVFLAIVLIGARQLYSTNRQLESTNRELLEVLVTAIEMRDPYTSGHSQRVAAYSRTIARAIGLSTREVQRIEIAALLHDVGKIDERFASILQKPGKLTPEERATIEEHPLKSEELVAKVTGLQDLLPAIRHHHERWDGTGYPDRIANESIPLGARIITFADTIDAMTTDRPYRRALGPEDVRAELLKHSGKQFDPAICDRLLTSPLFLELFKGLRPKEADSPGPRLVEPVIAA